MPLFFYLTSFYRLGQKYKNIFVHFLVQMKTLKSPFEIHWPLPCFYETNNQRSLECDLTSKNSFLMPPISKYFLIQPNWFPLLELIKKKIAILGTAALLVHGDISLWYCCYNFLKLHQTSLSTKNFQLHISFTDQ